MRPIREIPFGFAEVADRPIVYLMPEFHCSNSQIHRWRKELGIEINSKNKKRCVYQYDSHGQAVKRHNSIHSAARYVAGSPTNIWKAANGMIKTAYGYAWRYE